MNKDLKYVAVENGEGELIAYVDNEQVTIRDGYKVVEGYGEPVFEDVDGKVRLVHDNAIEVSPEER